MRARPFPTNGRCRTAQKKFRLQCKSLVALLKRQIVSETCSAVDVNTIAQARLDTCASAIKYFLCAGSVPSGPSDEAPFSSYAGLRFWKYTFYNSNKDRQAHSTTSFISTIVQLLKREFKQIQNSEWAAHFAVIDDLANVLARDPMSGTMHSRSPCLSALQYNQLIFALCAFIGMPSNVRADGVRDH